MRFAFLVDEFGTFNRADFETTHVLAWELLNKKGDLLGLRGRQVTWKAQPVARMPSEIRRSLR